MNATRKEVEFVTPPLAATRVRRLATAVSSAAPVASPQFTDSPAVDRTAPHGRSRTRLAFSSSSSPSSSAGSASPLLPRDWQVDYEDAQPQYTFDGLYGWYRKLVQQLGWIVISASTPNAMKERVVYYMHTLERAFRAIQEMQTVTKDEDRVRDLQTMYHHLYVVYEHAKKDFADFE